MNRSKELSTRERVLVQQIRELDKVSTTWSNCAGELTKLLDETREEIERLARERGQACYERDNARSVVKHWEERALAAEAEVERLKVLIEGHIRDAD